MKNGGKMKINEKGWGEIIDECLTLAFKVTHGNQNAVDRLDAISNYVADKLGENHNLSKIIDLMIINAYCWNFQDKIKSDDEEEALWSAKMAQKFNKTRNQVIGQLNGKKGIVTEKTY